MKIVDEWRIIFSIAARWRNDTFIEAGTPWAASSRARFRRELAVEFVSMDVTPALIAQAMLLAETHALRGSDAIQLAAALEARVDCRVMGLPLTLVSADAELNAAVAEGLTVNDSNTHP